MQGSDGLIKNGQYLWYCIATRVCKYIAGEIVAQCSYIITGRKLHIHQTHLYHHTRQRQLLDLLCALRSLISET